MFFLAYILGDFRLFFRALCLLSYTIYTMSLYSRRHLVSYISAARHQNHTYKSGVWAYVVAYVTYVFLIIWLYYTICGVWVQLMPHDHLFRVSSMSVICWKCQMTDAGLFTATKHMHFSNRVASVVSVWSKFVQYKYNRMKYPQCNIGGQIKFK